MKWAARTRRGALLLFLLLGVAVVFLLRTRPAWDAACNVARTELPRLLHAEVRISSCELNPLTQSVVLKDVEVAQARAGESGETPIFSAERAEIELSSFSPLFRKLTIAKLALFRPKITLDFRGVQAGGSPQGSSKGCFLSAAKRVDLERMSIEGGRLEILLPQGRKVELQGAEVHWKLRRGVGAFEISAADGAVSLGNGSELPVTRLVLQGLLSPGDEELELSRAELSLGESSFTVTGRVEDLCAPNLSLEAQAFVPLRELSKAIPLPKPAEGRLWSRISLSGEAKNPLATVELLGSQLRLKDFRPGDFRARASYAQGNLAIHSLSLESGAGSVKLSGAVQLIRGLPAHLRADLSNASFGDLLRQAGLPGSWVEFGASGWIQMAGRLMPLELSGDGDIRASHFFVANHSYDAQEPRGPPARRVEQKRILEFPAGQLAARVRMLPDRVELLGVRLEVGHTAFNGSTILHYDSGKGLELMASSDSVDLSDFHHVAGLRCSGRGSARAEIRGPYAQVAVDADLSLRDFLFWDYALGVVQGNLKFQNGRLELPAISGQKGHTPYHGKMWLDFGKTSGQGQALSVEAHANGGRTEDLVDLLSPLSSGLEVLRGALTGNASVDLRLEGPANRFRGEVQVKLQDTAYDHRFLGDGEVKLSFFDGQGMRLLPFSLRGKGTVLSADGTFLFSGPLDYRFRVEGFSLPELLGPKVASGLALGGLLSLDGTVAGSVEAPLISARISVPRVSLRDSALGALRLEARLSGKDLELWGSPINGASLRARLSLAAPYRYDAQLELNPLDLRSVLQGARAQGFSGTLRGSFHAQGALSDHQKLDASARIDQLSLSRADFRAENDGPLLLSWSNGRLSVEAFSFKGLNTELSLSGWAGMEDSDLQLKGALDIRLLESFVPQLERSSGKVEITASATGPLRDPAVVGEAWIEDGRGSWRDQPLNFSGLNGQVDFSEARILVEDLRGALNNGRIALRSDIRLQKLRPKRLEIGLQLDEVPLRPREDLPVTVTGELLLYGQPDALTLSGDLDLRKLHYDQPFQVEALLTDFKSGKTALPGEGSLDPKEWLSLDVGIHANGDVRVDNNLVQAKLTGDLKLTGTNLRPGLLGTVELTEGSQATFRGNQFIIRQGLLEFRDRRRIDPVFDLRAATQVREYLVSLHAFGRPDRPQVLLTAEPELSESDILSLLALGVVSKDRDTGGALTGAGLAAEALFNASGLGQQVQRFLPKNQVFRDLSFHLATSYNSVSGLVEPTAQLESKVLTDQLKLSMTQPVSGQGTRGTRAQAEYRFDDRVSAQAQWDNEVSGVSFGNLGLELKLRWEVE